MYVTEDIIQRIAERHGSPLAAEFAFAVSRKEYERIERSQKHGRCHDFTVYAMKDERVIVIAKPFYPPGLFRAPSGGLHPGEDAEDGIAREMMEETGCRVALRRFLLRTRVRFVESERGGPLRGDELSDPRKIEWYSYVLQADFVEGDFHFTDTDEIREVRLAALSEFAVFGEIMRGMDIGGLHYRAALHETVEGLLVL